MTEIICGVTPGASGNVKPEEPGVPDGKTHRCWRIPTGPVVSRSGLPSTVAAVDAALGLRSDPCPSVTTAASGIAGPHGRPVCDSPVIRSAHRSPQSPWKRRASHAQKAPTGMKGRRVASELRMRGWVIATRAWFEAGHSTALALSIAHPLQGRIPARAASVRNRTITLLLPVMKVGER